MSAGRRSQVAHAMNAPEGAPAAAGNNGAQRQRASLRGAILRSIQGVADDQALARLTLEQAATQARYLEQNWARWQDQHHLMMGGEGNDGIVEAAERIHIELEAQVLGCMARIEAQIRRRQQEREVVPVAAQAPQAQAIIVRHHREPKVGEFDGKHASWAAFFDLFRVEVDGREDMGPLEKLVYLKEACIGQGAKALGDWPTTAGNYQLAWQALQEKYNDPYVTKNRLIGAIQKMPRQRDETYDGLRTLIDTPKIALRQLAAMSVDVAGLDLQMLNTILYKAPDSVMDAWEQQRGGAEPTLDQLFVWLERRARSRMVSESIQADRARGRGRGQEKGREKDSGQPGRRQDNGQPGRRYREEKSDREAGQPSTEEKDQGPATVADNGQPSRGNEYRASDRGGNRGTRGPLRCWICEGSHSMFACHSLLSKGIKDRMSMMREKGVCLACGIRHAGNCRSPRQCEVCANEQHTELVCPKRINESGASGESNNRKRKA